MGLEPGPGEAIKRVVLPRPISSFCKNTNNTDIAQSPGEGRAGTVGGRSLSARVGRSGTIFYSVFAPRQQTLGPTKARKGHESRIERVRCPKDVEIPEKLWTLYPDRV